MANRRPEAPTGIRRSRGQTRRAGAFAGGARDEILATISHEIRTPVHALTGLLELLQLKAEGGEQARMLAVAHESAEALLRIVNDLQDFARLGAGRLDIVAGPARVDACTAPVETLFRPGAEGKGLDLVVAIEPGVPEAVEVDVGRIRQVLGNLVGNAIKFTERGAVSLEVSCGARHGEHADLLFVVADSGVGIAPADAAKLFRPFVKVGVGRRGRGTGLGLAISRHIAELMGGSLELRSVPGDGTTCTLRVPVRVVADRLQPEAAGDRGPARVEAPRSACGERILLCDDSALIRQATAHQLATLGHEVESVDCGEACVEAWKRGRHRFVLLDCRLPGMQGDEVARRIRELEAEQGCRAKTVILALTAHAGAAEKEACAAAGFDALAMKPLRIRGLKEQLDHWLGPPRDRETPTALAPFPGSAGGRPIDLRTLEEMVGSDPRFQREIVLEFLREKKPEVGRMAEWASDGEFDTLSRAAHRMRGAAMVVAASHLAEDCALLEMAARHRRRDETIRYAQEIGVAFEALAGFARSHFGTREFQ